MKNQTTMENGTEAKEMKNPLAGRVWTVEIERERIVPSATNPRKEFPKEMIEARAESLLKQGQLMALIVRVLPEDLVASEKKHPDWRALREPNVIGITLEGVEKLIHDPKTRFEIADGECRWRAAKVAGLKSLKCDVRVLSQDEMVEIQWASWLQREGLSPLDEAMGLAGLRAQGWSVERLCERFGKSKSHIFEKLKLSRLEGKARALVSDGTISPSVAALIASVPDKAAQEELLKGKGWGAAVFENDGSVKPVREVKEYIEQNCLRAIPWGLEQVFEKHPEWVSATCAACPKMTRNMGETNPEVVKGPARCMGLSCFKERARVVGELKKAEAKALGLEFMPAKEFEAARYSSDYLVEGDERWNGEKRAPVVKLAGKVPHTIVAEDPNGGVLRVWKRSDLEKAGVLKKEPNYGGSSGLSKAERAKAIMEGKVEARVIELVLERIEAKGEWDSIVLLRKLAHGLLASLWDDSLRKIAKRRGIGKEEIQKEAFVEKFGMAQCVGVLTEGLLLRGLRWSGGGLSAEAATWAKVDVAKVREEIKRAAKVEKKPKRENKQKAAKSAKGKGKK